MTFATKLFRLAFPKPASSLSMKDLKDLLGKPVSPLEPDALPEPDAKVVVHYVHPIEMRKARKRGQGAVRGAEDVSVARTRVGNYHLRQAAVGQAAKPN